MNFADISDDELFMLAQEENEDAKNMLYDRFRYIIDINMKKYKNLALKDGVDIKDFESEALLGFSDALSNYRSDKMASIPTFINLCVERRIKKLLVKANRLKNVIIKEAYSLDYVYEKFGTPLLDLISDESKNDPLQNMTKDENYRELIKSIHQVLSKMEQEVFKYMQEGLSYRQIATILKKDPKQIDNAMQRIKNKIKKILKIRKTLDYSK